MLMWLFSFSRLLIVQLCRYMLTADTYLFTVFS